MDYISPKLAHKVQRILGFGQEFQTTDTQSDEPFTTPFHFSLDLEHNTPPLTFFPLPKLKRDLQKEYRYLIDSVKHQTYKENLCIFSVDKGHGLVIVHKSDLEQIYKFCLDRNAQRVLPYFYYEAVRKLRTLLARGTSHEKNGPGPKLVLVKFCAI